MRSCGGKGTCLGLLTAKLQRLRPAARCFFLQNAMLAGHKACSSLTSVCDGIGIGIAAACSMSATHPLIGQAQVFRRAEPVGRAIAARVFVVTRERCSELERIDRRWRNPS